MTFLDSSLRCHGKASELFGVRCCNFITSFGEDMHTLVDIVSMIDLRWPVGVAPFAPPKEDMVSEMQGMYKHCAARKRTNGEVFTPIALVEHMLDALPASVWRKKDTRWLDPTAGFGVFPVLLFYRLMEGLRQEIRHEAERQRHIVENMLFMVELDGRNVMQCRRLLHQLGCGADPNVYEGDFLQWPSPQKFDVILGKPPYNSTSVKSGSAMWVRIVKACSMRLASQGHLLFVHPPGWRKPSGCTKTASDLWKMFRSEGALLHLEVRTDFKLPFPPEVDWYIWQKGMDKGGNTTVVSAGCSFSLSLSHLPFLPSVITLETIGIIEKVTSNNGEAQTYSFTRDNRFRVPAGSARGSIPHAHYWSGGDYRTLGLSAEQVRAMYPKGQPGLYTASKVVISLKASNHGAELHPKHYHAGTTMGVTSSVMFQEMSAHDAGSCVRFLNSTLVRAIMRLCQYSPSPYRKNEARVVNSLRAPPKRALVSENSLYDFFQFSAAERQVIRRYSQ